jgi:phage terminase large subunit
MFDEGVHVGSYKYRPGWPLYRVIDFGFTNPFACVYIQIDPSDNVYIVDEYYVKGMVVEDHAAALKAIEQRTAHKYEATYADAEDPEGIATLRKHGIKALPIGAPVEAGVDLVRSMLQVQASTHKPRLFVDHASTNTILEFTMYQYPETRDHQFVREQPKKKNDHCMDPIKNLVWLKLRMPMHGRMSDIVTVPSRVDLGELEL